MAKTRDHTPCDITKSSFPETISEKWNKEERTDLSHFLWAYVGLWKLELRCLCSMGNPAWQSQNIGVYVWYFQLVLTGVFATRMKIALSWCGETLILEEETTAGQHISHPAGCAARFIYPIYEMSWQKSDMERRSIRFQDTLLLLLTQERSLIPLANHLLSHLFMSTRCRTTVRWSGKLSTVFHWGRRGEYSSASPCFLK